MRWVSLDQLGLHLSHRYRRLGEIVDIEEAILFGREAVDLCPRGHPKRARLLNNLAFSLFTRYKQLGGMTDLNDAILIGREALDLCPQGRPDRSTSFSSLGLYLSTRYNQLGGTTDLNEVILLGREALDLCPQGHPDRLKSLSILAAHLPRYKHLGGMIDLNDASILCREAIDLCPQGRQEPTQSSSTLPQSAASTCELEPPSPECDMWIEDPRAFRFRAQVARSDNARRALIEWCRVSISMIELGLDTVKCEAGSGASPADSSSCTGGLDSV